MDETSKLAKDLVSKFSSEHKRVWNAAIRACILKLEKEFVAPEIVIKIIEELKI